MRPFLRIFSVSLLAVSCGVRAADDDRIEAPPEAPKPKSTLNWERLMESTNTQPIEIPATSQSREQANASLKRWVETRIAGPERARLKDAPDRVEILKFLDDALQRWMGFATKATDAELFKQAEEIIDGPTRRAVIDYFAAALLWAAGPEKKKLVLQGFTYVTDAPDDGSCPSLLRALSQAEVVVHRDSADREFADPAFRLLDKFMAANLAEVPADEDEAYWTVHFHVTSDIDYVRDRRERRYRELYLASKLPEWARLTLAGEAGIGLAWRKGGYGMGHPTGKPEEIEEIKERTEKDLTRAWELKPSAPFAPTAMIQLAARRGASAETLREWFDRSVAAKYDYTPAIKNYLSAMSPYWSGSQEALLAFGRACAETKRYDSDLPTRFNEAVAAIASNRADWRFLYHHRELSALLFETRQKRIQAAGDDLVVKIRHASCLTVEAWAAGNLDLAASALEGTKLPEGKFRYDNTAVDLAQKLGVDFQQVLQEVGLYHGAARQEYLEGTTAMARKDYEAAGKAFQNAVAKADAFSQPLLSANIALADFQQHFDAGDWAPIPVQHRMAWLRVDNENNWDPEKKRLQLTGNWYFGRSLFRGELGTHFEVRGHLRTNTSAAAAGVGLYLGNTPYYTGRSEAWWYTVRIDPQMPNNEVDYAPKYSGHQNQGGSLPWTADDAFVLRRDGDRVNFSIGNRELVKNKRIPEDAGGGPGAWGLGVLGQGKGATSLVWGLEARRLDAKK